VTESRNPQRVPVSHVVFRVLLGSIVASLLVIATVLAVLHHATELTAGRNVWVDVKKWALPW
jgi:hypothetical protein